MAPLVYRPRQAAHALQLGLATVRRKIKSGEIASTKVGRARLIPAEEVERLAGTQVRHGDR